MSKYFCQSNDENIRIVIGYTCGNDSRHNVLVAKEDGWHCPDCDYRQNWASPYMLSVALEKYISKEKILERGN